MGKKLDFSFLDSLFISNKSFELTSEEYKKKVGKEMPSGDKYIKYSSQLADIARKYGYKIDVVEEATIVRKLVFNKKG